MHIIVKNKTELSQRDIWKLAAGKVNFGKTWKRITAACRISGNFTMDNQMYNIAGEADASDPGRSLGW